MAAYEFFQFQWSCSEQGYEWKHGKFIAFGDTQDHQGPMLVPVREVERVYVPPRNLFLEFASLDPTRDDDILKFATAYGLLGGAPVLFPKRERTFPLRGEPKSHWVEQLHHMKAAVSLREALRANDTELLSRCIKWRGTDRIDYHWPPSSDLMTPWSTHATIASKDINPDLFKQFRPKDVEMPARVYLQKVVNENLERLAAPRLLWMIPDRDKMGLFIVPNSLIGCLWLQLASAIAELRTFRICEGCSKPMLVAPEGSGFRANRKTCSDACRVRLYARRKEEARKLHSQKVSRREIAKRLNIEVDQVRNWIAQR